MPSRSKSPPNSPHEESAKTSLPATKRRRSPEAIHATRATTSHFSNSRPKLFERIGDNFRPTFLCTVAISRACCISSLAGTGNAGMRSFSRLSRRTSPGPPIDRSSRWIFSDSLTIGSATAGSPAPATRGRPAVHDRGSCPGSRSLWQTLPLA